MCLVRKKVYDNEEIVGILDIMILRENGGKMIRAYLTSNSGLGCSSCSSISRSHSQAKMDWRLFHISTKSVATTSY